MDITAGAKLAFAILLWTPVLLSGAEPNPSPELISLRKIWDKARHNAFTDLVRHRDRWWCVFREGQRHVSPDGAIRVITSSDGTNWESAALLRSETADLRDPKITLTPDGRLMINGAGALHRRGPNTHQSYAWFSEDGRGWSEPVPVGDPNYWLWRVTWQKGVAYGVGYKCSRPYHTRLYRSADGRKFEPLLQEFYTQGGPNESSIVFLPDDTAICLLRRDPSTGLLGTARPPYTAWEWKDLQVRIGGPHQLLLPNGKLLAAVRLYDRRVRTSLCWIDAQRGALEECLAPPSGGDTSYAGLIWHEGVLWMSYYSSHEGKTAIYLARIKIPGLPAAPQKN